jgi:Tol biopolymer transport system component
MHGGRVKEALLIATAVALAVPAAATAAYPGDNGPILFDTGGGGDIFSIRPDGSDRRLIIENGREPAVSADGTKIVFVRGGDLFTADRLGGSEQQVTATDDVAERNPSFSPSGNKILFNTDRSTADGEDPSQIHASQIFTVRWDGAERTLVTGRSGQPGGQANFDPEYSPNGKRIIFVRIGNDAVERPFMMFADGTNVEELTFSPCELPRCGSPFGLAVDPPTSRDLTWQSPSWSPDGDRIAFSGLDGNFSIFTARPDATGLQQLTGAGLGDHEPAWSPNGNKIVFRGKRDGVSGLFTVDRSGFVERLTRSTPKPGVGVDGEPYWVPQR